ncbi:hypothetical protein Scep_017895 [Stephania cephalantha]|uniref:Uncharacterized protein n=1 Tax=Stephania cephalantha TaxID=152367 RepID=A0AAP0IQD9_9MAGN
MSFMLTANILSWVIILSVNALGLLITRHVSFTNQKAYIFTKPLPKATLVHFAPNFAFNLDQVCGTILRHIQMTTNLRG